MFRRRTAAPGVIHRPAADRPDLRDAAVPRALRAGPALLCAALVLTLSACDSGGSREEGKAASGPSVIAPGKPGEAARTLSAEDAQEQAADDSPNAADFTYARMMIEHHGQALVMTELVPSRADSGQVKRVAARITAAQKPEIGAMQGWLDNNKDPKKPSGSGDDHGAGGHGGETPDPGSHEHGSMPGMATEAQLAKLRAADGKAFDELFLKLMITHHEGAITMATEALSEGNNVLVEEMATDVIAQQTAEIGRMRDML